MTAGERRFAVRLQEKLDDDCLIWYDVPIGEKKLHHDKIGMHPERGLLVLEVKDWQLDNIQSATHQNVELRTEAGTKRLKNPLEQARDYALAINQLLEKDPDLMQPSTSQHKGKLLCPYGYGAVLTNIRRNAFDAVPAMSEVLDSHLVLCQDEFFDAVDADEFQARLWAMSPYHFGIVLNTTQVDRIRWHLFPEVRITAKQLELLAVEPEPTPREPVRALSIMQVLDLQQEQLARSLGDGHRVVHGVAGSGKTLILAYRAQYLAEQTQKPVLVLCFNVALAAHLESMIRARGDLTGPPVLVRHFHGWCKDLLKTFCVALPAWTKGGVEVYLAQLVQRVAEAVGSGQIPSGLYGAVLIDEGHDFKASWLQLVTQMVSAETNSLLLLYDDAQCLYGRQRNQFSFRSVGIEAVGRTTILKVNYRNPAEVLRLAYGFIQADELEVDDSPDCNLPLERHCHRPRLLPQSAGKSSALPELVMLSSLVQEAVYLAERVQQFHEKGTPWRQIAIVYREKFVGEVLAQQLTRAGVPIEWLNRDRSSRFFDPMKNSVKLLTMHSCKGLEFEIVCIPGIGFLPYAQCDLDTEQRLFYVAMTRATNRLLLTAHRTSEYTQKLAVGLQLAQG